MPTTKNQTPEARRIYDLFCDIEEAAPDPHLTKAVESATNRYNEFCTSLRGSLLDIWKSLSHEDGIEMDCNAVKKIEEVLRELDSPRPDVFDRIHADKEREFRKRKKST